jgi:predicted transcriptional regulator of viral defense system
LPPKGKAIQDKLHISELQREFKDVSAFDKASIVLFYQKLETEVLESTINWRIYHLTQKGVLKRIGRGIFTLGKEVAFEPEINLREKRIYSHLKKELPYLDCCVWNFDLLKSFAQHIPSRGILFVEVERHAAESAFYILRDKYKNVQYLKDKKEIRNAFYHHMENVIVVRPLVTEAPVRQMGKTVTATLEKILVDVFCDDEFEFLRGYELSHIFKNAFAAYTVNQSKLLRYAARKEKKEELLTFLENYNLAVI